MRKKKLTENFVMKVTAYFLTITAVCMTVACLLGIVWASENNLYQPSFEDVREELLSWQAGEKTLGIASFLYPLRDRLIPMALLAAFIGISSFIFLMCSAGKKYGREPVKAVGFAAVPMDLLTALLAIGAFLLIPRTIPVLSELFSDRGTHSDLVGQATFLGILLFGCTAIAVGYCIIVAIQSKAGILWKNMLLYRLFKILVKFINNIVRLSIGALGHISLIWKLPLFLALLIILQLAVILVIGYRGVWAIWIAERVLLLLLVPYFGVVFYKLKMGGEELAHGNLGFQVNTEGMFGECRAHGENLNSLGGKLNLVVEERMKSERMKTELITNVSHDIKTPLTSIINYTDLIVKEETENKKITEYSLVLKRQSARLKKLIEDLVEVSKASTGNVEVHLAPCEAGVLLTQVVGEYEQRLAEQELELVTRLSAQSARIMADGKLLWRVFDNLLNNIIKYAQSKTRVYVTVEESAGTVEIAFKNVSRYPLDITPEELRERFVRGDHSRNTEGNGLGLSIAESLTRLQNGEMILSVDGDLFKVLLRFPALPQEHAEENGSLN